MGSGKRTILMLGGSRQQVIAIETAKRLGLRTVLCDYLPDNPGQYAADVFYLKSTTDLEEMLEVAKAEHAEGILAYSSDPAARTAAYVAERLGLPTNPLASVDTLSVKHVFRRHLSIHGFPCPKSAPFPVGSSSADLVEATREMTYPVVLKPTDSSGSKGVCIIEEPDERLAADAIRRAGEHSRNGILVLEEYIESTFPRVIGGDVFVADGEVRFWGLMSCLRDERLGGLVPVGERHPSGMTEAQRAAVKEQIQRLVDSLDIRFGELNVEMIIGRDDVPYFLELGARAGGNMIPVQLSDISGIDLVEANVRYAMGDSSMDVSFDGNDVANATYVLHAESAGVFAGVSCSDDIAPHVYRKVMYANPGDKVSSFDGANKALGIFFLRFDDVEQMESLLEGITDKIRVRVDPAAAVGKAR